MSVYFTGLLSGILLCLFTSFIFRFWQQSEATKRRIEAKKTLAKYGYTLQMYMPFLPDDNKELRHALNEFALGYYVITNADNEIMGRLLPTAQAKKPVHLKLVGAKP